MEIFECSGAAYEPGTYSLQIDDETSVNAFCLDEGWTVFQSRGQWGNPRDYFLEDWSSYEDGFGIPGIFFVEISIFIDCTKNHSKLGREHWLGLKAINELTNSGVPMQLKIEMESFYGPKSFIMYDNFVVGDQVFIF